jgi:hypothetical protein
MVETRACERSDARPRWGWLYVVVLVLGGLLTSVEFLLAEGFARSALELVVSLGVLGVIAVWVRANRVALALQNEAVPARPAPLARVPARPAAPRRAARAHVR